MNILKLLPALLLCGMVGPGQNAEEGPEPARPRGSDEDGHRYYPPRKSRARPGHGREEKPITATQKLFPHHPAAGLPKAEKNAAKRERRARRAG